MKDNKKLITLSENIYNKSIIFIGEIGAGKSTIANRLSTKINLPILSTDIMRNCPMNLTNIRSQIKYYSAQQLKLQAKIQQNNSEKNQNELTYCIDKVNFYNNQLRSRVQFPDLPNIHTLGFNPEIHQYFKQYYGIETAIAYKAKYEIMFLFQAVNSLKKPFIIDCGGLSSVIPENTFNEITESVRKKSKIDAKDLEIPYSNQDIINLLKPFKNIYYIKLPDEYMSSNNITAKKFEIVNDIILKSKQNKLLSTKIIESENFINDDKSLNNKKINNIVESLTNEYQNQCSIKNEESHIIA